MATHARQQYFADESSLSKEKREFSIAEEVQQKIDSIEEWAQVNKIETIKVNWSEVQPDENKAVDLTIPWVVDGLDSTSSTDALSARQGKVLYDYIQDVSHIGHFLALWDASTWLPVTDPETSPYIYNTWDFYTVSVVASWWGTNYKPDGTQYVIWQASTAVDTDNVAVNDFYFYDGATWRHMKNSWAGSIAVDGSLSTTSTNPVENRVITNALNGKADATDVNTKTFYLSSTSDLTNAQAAYDWWKSGKEAIIYYDNRTYTFERQTTASFDDPSYSWPILLFNYTRWPVLPYDSRLGTASPLNAAWATLYLWYSNDVVSIIIDSGVDYSSILPCDSTTPIVYSPYYNWDPATKKYVDDHAWTTYTAWANIQISAQNVISATDTKYTAWTWISIDANNVISNTQTSAEWWNITWTLSDQTDLQNALNTKADKEDVNVKVFHIATTNDLIKAQEAIDWWEQGRLTGAYTPLIEFWWGKELYGLLSIYDNYQAIFTALTPEKTQSRTNTTVSIKQIVFSLTGTPWQPQTVTAISTSNYLDVNYLDTDTSYSSSYTPQYDWSPATKKYVDDSVNLKSFWAFPGSWLSDLQDLYDWLTAWNYWEVTYGNQVYIFWPTNITTWDIESYTMRETNITDNESGMLDMKDTVLTFAVSNWTVTGNYWADSTTTWQWRIIYVNSAAWQPSNPQASSFWYDTTNNKLKVYDWTNWNEIGKEYIAGEGIIIWHIGYKNKWPAPEWYHMPTSVEFKNIHTIWVNIWAWTTESWTPVSTYLRMPYTGARDYTSWEWRTSGGNYWTCSWRRTSVTATNRLSWGTWGFNDTSNDAPSTTSGLISQYWFPIRALKNEYVAPDSSWTTAFDGSSHAAWAWIFRNETLWLISISDWTTWYTLADKNLWATQVYTYWDELTDANCGSLFQWWNNYAFPRTWTVTTATGVVNVDWYWPFNPYSSSTFYLYTTSRWWAYWGASDNLWWWEEAGEGVIPWDGNIIENILPFDPSNYWSTWQLLTKTSSWYDWETKYTLPTGTATTGYVLTKIGTSASAYAWRQGWLQKASNSPLNIQYFWAWTQAEYDALESYSDDTVYFTI